MRASIKGSRVLVTGGAGFIGSHLVDALLLQEAAEVVIIDNMFLGKRSNLSSALSKGAILYEKDAEHNEALSEIIEQHNIEIVFNLATKALNYSFIDPLDAYLTNVVVLGNLLELQRKGSFNTLCHFSSSEVYGTACYEPMDENHPYNATTTYAGGKAAADIMLKTWVNMFDLDAFIVRPFNNYGPRQNWVQPLASVIPLTVRRIMNGEPPEIHGSGKQSRDLIYVTDTVDATLKLFDVMQPGQEVNISADGSVSIEALVSKIAQFMCYEGDVVWTERRKADVDCHNATNALCRSLIDLHIRGIDEGLEETIEWYRENIT
ncbi:MAG: NAD-dependent epimerase/dehydratase family protein [Coriobacteriia bacterium]|nr:NAD-dependent epimerase/dehydratase family protein [Coriobacteriia bacterium]MCL2749752.1 NAD-dependent epimerase/dehydratase family protein [Coriobacteriia bacterium]